VDRRGDRATIISGMAATEISVDRIDAEFKVTQTSASHSHTRDDHEAGEKVVSPRKQTCKASCALVHRLEPTAPAVATSS